MSKAQILVICSAATGYRRGGVALDQGDNIYDRDQFTEEQLQQLEADPRLTVALMDESEGETETDPGSEKEGTVDADGLGGTVEPDDEGAEPVALADMSVPDLKKLAKEYKIKGYTNMGKDKLVAELDAALPKSESN